MAQQQPSDERYMKEEMIVIAMDLGTTNSAVSFSYLYPGTVPVVQMVSRWPGHPEASGDSKIPSLIAYREGCAVAYGAEAREYEADDEYEVAKWFKLHLHPESMKVTDQPPAYGTDHLPQMAIPALPQGITLTHVYTDLMKYMFQGARSFFDDRNALACNRNFLRNQVLYSLTRLDASCNLQELVVNSLRVLQFLKGKNGVVNLKTESIYGACVSLAQNLRALPAVRSDNTI